MSNINLTIAAETANSANSANPATPASPVFFLVFAGETVELSLTNSQSTTYKTPSHRSTQSVNL